MPAEKSTADKPDSKAPENPAQIELLETRIRFEENGDSRKEVHAHVRINSELGVRQFARLNFNYNRSFESVEIPLVRVSHANGGTSDILPSAITDKPDPAVVNAPAYQDVRVKSVRILGLSPGDSLDYRVVTTVSHHPLAPDFCYDHSFDRTGVVARETLEVDVPILDGLRMRARKETPASSTNHSGSGNTARTIYLWDRSRTKAPEKDQVGAVMEPDLAFTTFATWAYLSERVESVLVPGPSGNAQLAEKAAELTRNAKTPEEKIENLYDFVSKKITTVDIPLGSTGFRTRLPSEIIASSAATAEDKFAIFSALAQASGVNARAFLTGALAQPKSATPSLGSFNLLLIEVWTEKRAQWLDANLEVAPLGMIPVEFRGKPALPINNWSKSSSPLADFALDPWTTIPDTLPFEARQSVKVDAALSREGTLSTKVHYALRGDNELLLRVAFHQTPKDKWKDLANLLAISDGFRGQVSSVIVSDPYATREPFTVDYEIAMPKFVDWAKKPVRIPALLPQVALPDPPAKAVASSAVSPIELGTPLEVETSMTLKLPAGTTARYPTGTSVERDYATFYSQYARDGSALTASRHIKFILREVPAARVFDYNAFMRAVQNDSSQDFILERAETSPAKTDSAAPSPAAPPKSN